MKGKEPRVWACNNFRTQHPVGDTAIVVAETEDQARECLYLFLEETGLTGQDLDDLTVSPVPLEDGHCQISCRPAWILSGQ